MRLILLVATFITMVQGLLASDYDFDFRSGTPNPNDQAFYINDAAEKVEGNQEAGLALLRDITWSMYPGATDAERLAKNATDRYRFEVREFLKWFINLCHNFNNGNTVIVGLLNNRPDIGFAFVLIDHVRPFVNSEILQRIINRAYEKHLAEAGITDDQYYEKLVRHWKSQLNPNQFAFIVEYCDAFIQSNQRII